MPRLKVLHLLDNSNLGGIQELILRLHLYSRHRHDFRAADGSMAAELLARGMVLWDGQTPPEAYCQYDVVVGHGVGGWAYDDSFGQARHFGQKTVEVMHSIARSLTEPRLADGFIALSDLALERNRHMPRAQRIYVPVETHLFPASAPPGALAIGRLSRLAEEKEAWRLVPIATHFPGQHFLIAGDGPDRERIEREAMPNLQLAGTVRDLPAFYARLKLFVFPTRDECCSAAVAQAQAAGLPVICADIPALRETTGGYAVFCRTDFDFVNAIQAYLDYPKPYERIARLGQAWAIDQFAIERTVGAWDAYLSETVGSPRALGKADRSAQPMGRG